PRRTRWMYLSGAATVRRQISRQSDADEVSNRLQPIERAANAKPAAIENVQIDHRRVQIRMAEQFLDRADVVSCFEQMCRKAVSKRVTASVLCDFCLAHCLFYRLL